MQESHFKTSRKRATGAFLLGSSVPQSSHLYRPPQIPLGYSPRGRKNRLLELEACQVALFLFLSYSGINVLFHRKRKVYMLALFFRKKFIPNLFLLFCKAKTTGNLRKLKKYTVQSHLFTNKESEPRELRQSQCWKVLAQNTDALTPAREEHSPPPSHYGFHGAHVSSTLHSWHPETFIYLFFSLLNIVSWLHCFFPFLVFSLTLVE